MKQPSNSVLLEKINNIKESLEKVERHLAQLNGSVAKNQRDVIIVKNVYTIILPILTLILGYLINSILNR